MVVYRQGFLSLAKHCNTPTSMRWGRQRCSRRYAKFMPCPRSTEDQRRQPALFGTTGNSGKQAHGHRKRRVTHYPLMEREEGGGRRQMTDERIQRVRICKGGDTRGPSTHRSNALWGGSGERRRQACDGQPCEEDPGFHAISSMPIP